ncbi:hypothetical protein Salat_2595600 [Sesamum alatum]|uniref:Uncharacterized protein n=1 Tax=Sesamum alatum TaxID=300844 RepID=A0AAE1XP18_9LAMI|nr:hypothetical protein Salat_2595600 [Sesamum alatum]
MSGQTTRMKKPDSARKCTAQSERATWAPSGIPINFNFGAQTGSGQNAFAAEEEEEEGFDIDEVVSRRSNCGRSNVTVESNEQGVNNFQFSIGISSVLPIFSVSLSLPLRFCVSPCIEYKGLKSKEEEPDGI